MKKAFLALVLFGILMGCATTGTQNVRQESAQQALGVSAIIQNQPVPDLGGYSWDREVMSKVLLWRNKPQQTYAYMIDFGKTFEVCPSLGMPIPFATQITSPEQENYTYYSLPQPEPDSLYRPDSAEATYIMCLNVDGTVTPTYWEPRMFVLPYRIKADVILERITEPAFKIEPPK